MSLLLCRQTAALMSASHCIQQQPCHGTAIDDCLLVNSGRRPSLGQGPTLGRDAVARGYYRKLLRQQQTLYNKLRRYQVRRGVTSAGA
jgi:hypothetical protein